MPALLIIALWVIVIILLAVVLFWVLRQMALPEPAAMIARVIVGVLVLFLILGLFVPALGVHFPALR
jgi:hypothetical protein